MISLRNSIIGTLIVLSSFAAFAAPVFAQSSATFSSTNPPASSATFSTTNPTPTTSVSPALLNPLQASTLGQLLQEVLTNFVVPVGSIFLTIMIIYVGFLFVAARGAPEKVSQARSALLWTVVGGLILLGASALSIVITTTASSL